MKQKISSLFVLLVLLLTGLQVSAQSTPKPFDIEQPSLRVFLPAPGLATGRAVVACPGGGYSGLAVNHEGYDWAPYFNKQGIALIVLKYRMPKGDRTLPISDAEAAMKMVRDSADVWNLNPNDIGIMGSDSIRQRCHVPFSWLRPLLHMRLKHFVPTSRFSSIR